MHLWHHMFNSWTQIRLLVCLYVAEKEIIKRILGLHQNSQRQRSKSENGRGNQKLVAECFYAVML